MGNNEAAVADTVLDHALKLIPDEVASEHQAAAEAFASICCRRLPAGPREDYPLEELAKMILRLFDFIRQTANTPIRVRVFSPDQDRDGYETEGSVLEVNVTDSPFLLDSVSNEVQRQGPAILWVLHPVIGAERNQTGDLQAVVNARTAAVRESIQHYQLDRRVGEEEAAQLEEGVSRVLADVGLAVKDFRAMRERVGRMVEFAKSAAHRSSYDEVAQAVAFLEWLLDDNFVLLGFREYEVVEMPQGKAVRAVPGSGLGILCDPDGKTQSKLLSEMSADRRVRWEGGDLLVVTKTNRDATVHRRAKMDYIGVRRLGPNGETLGEGRILGLFTSKAYMEPAAKIPVIRGKLDQIIAREDLIEGSHDHKAVIQVFEGFPKDELFSAPVDDLHRSVMGLVHLQERQQVRLFIRRDLLERSVSVLVALPRDRFNADLRRQLQELFKQRFNGGSVEYHLDLGESDPAQIHFTVWVESGTIPEVSFAELEAEVVELARTWEDRLRDRLAATWGSDRAAEMISRWSDRLPDYYKSIDQLALAVNDIERLDKLASSGERFLVGVQNEMKRDERLTRVALYRLDGKLPLSDLVPAIEDLGVSVVEEVPTRLSGEGDVFIHDFGVSGADGGPLDLDDCGARVARALTAVWKGDTESDSLHRLVVVAGLTHSEVSILRAYRTYARRVNPQFTLAYVNDTFAAYPAITVDLVRLFQAKFDPEQEGSDPQPIRDRIVAALDAIPSLEQDRILRTFYGIIEATVRTNAYRPDRHSLCFKIRSIEVPEMPKPYPLFEIFVYAAQVEGIHLRGGMVARGGIRWSDRREDYRTEVLGLMKAQMTKNAVIVPTGAKGGFVLRNPSTDHIKEDVKAAYSTFIRGLLDVTDNLSAGKVVRPAYVRAHDVDDTYLVVAADKGTATFSDLANSIAAEYGFWLGDAFASGGSAGYDHKVLGITAKGAWESGKRHFSEAGTDINEQFTAVGIGDMSGDVFGNGMIEFETISLVAAFDHRHIFLDPTPDPGSGFKERSRLFSLPGSSWDDYDRTLISAGGGVYPRSAKKVEISAEARAALGTEVESTTPNELIKIILRSPVDLLWNGGIGTYVKSSTETDFDVGDRTNDAVRIDGRELRARIVVEGGNLGFTQRGRIEYARLGGRINTDFIDNSGGVDCSDREVNLKILLGVAEERKVITSFERSDLVTGAVEGVVKRILYDNFQQAQIISQAAARSARRIQALEATMQLLEAEGLLDRDVEALPSPDEMRTRRSDGLGMTRPELAVLVTYAKRSVYEELMRSELPSSDYLLVDLETYFPSSVTDRLGSILAEHPLRRELVATLVANDLVNAMGITFVAQVAAQSGAALADVVSAYRIARDVVGAVPRWEAIEALFGKVDLDIWNELIEEVDDLVERTARWFLARGSLADLSGTVSAFAGSYAEVEVGLPKASRLGWREQQDATIDRVRMAGVPTEVAWRHAYQPLMVHAPNIIELAEKFSRPVSELSEAFFALGESLPLDRLADLAVRIPVEGYWQRWALQTAEDDLVKVRREVVEKALVAGEGLTVGEAVTALLARNGQELERLNRFLRAMESDGVNDLSQLTLAVRQVRSLLA